MFVVIAVTLVVIGYWGLLQFMFWKLFVQNRKSGMSPVGYGKEQSLLGVMWISTLLLIVCVALVVAA